MPKLSKNTLVSLEELTDITGRTKQNINKMAADGVITRHARGVYKLGDVMRAMLSRRDPVPTQERYWRAKAEEVEHRNAVAKKQVIPIEDVRALTGIMEGARYGILQSLPTVLFRSDREKRRELEKKLNDMWNEASRRIEREMALLDAPGEPDDNDNDNEEKRETETKTQTPTGADNDEVKES